MSNTGHHDPFCSPATAQFVGNHYAWSARRCTQQLAEEPHGSKSIPPWLHENIEDNAVLIDRSPEVMRGSVDLEEAFIQMPFIPGRARRLRRPAAYSWPNSSHQRSTVS
jgi:hypothetical protein